MSVQPSGFLYPQDLPDAIQRLKVATAGDQRAAIALDVLLLELESRDSEDVRELKAMGRRVADCVDRVYGDNASNRDVPADERTHSAQTITYGATLVGYIRHGGELSEWFNADRRTR